MSTLFADDRLMTTSHGQKTGPILLAMKAVGAPYGPLGVARWLAVREGHALNVVTVLDAPAVVPIVEESARDTPCIYEDERATLACQIDDMVRGAPFQRLKVRSEVAFGPVAQNVVRIAREQGAALIVVGAGRKEVTGRGRRARQILRMSPVPVLLVPQGTTPAPFLRAAAAVDFSAASLSAANTVLPLLGEGGHLTLCHVKSAFHLSERDVGTFDQDYAARTEELFGDFVRALDIPAGVTVSTRLLHGATAPQILEHIEREESDILVCGSRKLGAIRRLFLGTVSAELVRHADIPVLVVPETLDDAQTDDLELAGVERWPEGGWSVLLTECAERHRGEKVRLEIAADSPGEPCLVAQNYELLDLMFDPHGARLAVVLREPKALDGQLTLWFPSVHSLTLESNLEGCDRHLAFENNLGHGALHFAAAHRPVAAHVQ